ncbi:MAG: methyltransferase domain-containing protein [Pyrinomonadaceae bacterium]|nr:methyltransferase domain-containing protein [Pyrinomonadaceae bacterium]MBP6213371.1 methyltransferase domain-containing protein [Pyrinomonadaceae bacterium]
MNCRFCQNALTHEFVDLGSSPPSNSYLSKDRLNEPEVFYPLRVFVCEECFLVQIEEYKKADEIFDQDYLYFSSFSQSWLEHSRRYVEMMCERFGFGHTSQVIEIASNDGYLLQYFRDKAVPVLGIEPTLSTARVAREKQIETLTEFFGTALAERLSGDGRQADLLLGNNVLAHVPDINDFVAGLAVALKPSGVITMEFPHLMQLVANNQFDTIYHEHFSYLSLYTVKRIFTAHGLDIFDVDELSTHGGSLRIYARHSGDLTHETTPRVDALLAKEKAAGLQSIDYYLNFQPSVERIKYELLSFLIEQKRAGKRVVAYGAAAKGNTLLNYCGVRRDLVEFVVDASPHKQGRFMPASHIPIVDETNIRANKPDYILILPWNIKQEILAQLSYISEWGGQCVVSIPALQTFGN